MMKKMRVNRKKRTRKGVAVLEVMVGMVVLSIGLLGVAGMTVTAARRATGMSTQSTRDGIVLQELNRVASLPYDTLDTRAGCSTSSSGTLAYSRCIAVTTMSDGLGYKRVRIIVTPTSTYARPETVYVNRARATTTSTPLPE